MNIGIVGVGLIGGSFAMAVRKYRPEDKLFLCEKDPETIAKARLLMLEDGALDSKTLPTLDLLLISLYPAAAEAWLEENAAAIAKKTVVVDCAGIKRGICEVGNRLAEKYGFIFVGGHPMAGREVWGISAASPVLYAGASMILTPAPTVGIETLVMLKSWFLSLGFGRLTIKTPEEHDRIIAYTSQLAHILSSAYIESPTAEEHRGLSAGSFRDMTRVAAINADMWSDIFLENKDNLLAEMDTLIENLSLYRNAIAACDRETVRQKLEEGAARKAMCDRV